MIPLFALIGAAAIVLVCMWWKMRSRLIGGRQKERILSLWKALDTLEDPAMKVLQADTVLDEALKLAGYTGSMGEKLKQVGPRLSNVNAVWDAHKLRNRIAHESGMRVSDHDATKALSAFQKAITILLK